MDMIALPHRFALRGSPVTVVPTDPWRGRASGPSPYRVLYMGSETTTSAGVATHDLGLLGHLARSLHGVTGHGVDVFGMPMAARGVLGQAHLLLQCRVPKVDTIVIEVPDRASAREWDKDRALWQGALAELCSRMPKRSHLVLLTRQSGARTVRDALEPVVSQLPRSAQLVALTEHGEPSRERYEQWASVLAQAVASRLRYPFHWSNAIEELDETERTAALQHVPSESAQFASAMQRLVEMAAAAYGTSHAAVSVIDDLQTRYVSTFGPTRPHATLKEESICSSVLGRYAGIIISDARMDSRFSSLPVVADGLVGFYAGFRILDPSGIPIGAICVSDDCPRPVLSQDIDVLRDIAAVAERRIWELIASRARGPEQWRWKTQSWT